MVEFAPLIGINYPALVAQLNSRDQRGATDAVRKGICRLLGPDFPLPPKTPDKRFRENNNYGK